MAIDLNWIRRCKITIDSTKVSSTETDYQLIITEDNLPSEMFDADGTYPAKSDGADLRFATTSAGTQELAFDVIDFFIDNDPANGRAMINVKIPSLSSSTDTEIWVFYNNSSASAYGVSDTYGQYNSYSSNVLGFWPMQESGDGTTDEFKDRTSNQNHGTGGSGTGSATPTRVSGHIGYAQDFDGGDFIDLGDNLFNSKTSGSIITLTKNDATGSLTVFGLGSSQGGTLELFTIQNRDSDPGTMKLHINNRSPFNYIRCDDTDKGTTNYFHEIATSNASTVQGYVNGNSESMTDWIGTNVGDWFASVDGAPTYNIQYTIGTVIRGSTPIEPFDGKINLVYLYDDVKNTAFSVTSDNNLRDNTNFSDAGTPENNSILFIPKVVFI